jgi:putative addiction module component (TIGR02574 family)
VRYTRPMTESDLEAAALRLPPKERARLAERLLASLETLTAHERDDLWADEALRRDAELDAQPERGRDGDSVFHDARSRLGG